MQELRMETRQQKRMIELNQKSAAPNTILSQQNALIIKGAYCCKVWC